MKRKYYSNDQPRIDFLFKRQKTIETSVKIKTISKIKTIETISWSRLRQLFATNIYLETRKETRFACPCVSKIKNQVQYDTQWILLSLSNQVDCLVPSFEKKESDLLTENLCNLLAFQYHACQECQDQIVYMNRVLFNLTKFLALAIYIVCHDHLNLPAAAINHVFEFLF